MQGKLRGLVVGSVMMLALVAGTGAVAPAADAAPPGSALVAAVERKPVVAGAKRKHVVTGGFRDLWLELRGAKGFLGEPLADRRCTLERTRCTQRFEGGTLTWRKGSRVEVAGTRDASSTIVVVNKRRPLSPRAYAPARLRTVKGSNQRLRPEAATALEKLMRAAAADGVPLTVRSGYRSYATQKVVYARWVRTLGKARADRVSARTGHSEHQTGLAVDVLARGSTFGTFGRTPQARWVARNAWRYGFIVRYRAGQEKVTGYSPEPWHLRYVGVALATDMRRSGSTSLEAHLRIAAAPDYR